MFGLRCGPGCRQAQAGLPHLDWRVRRTESAESAAYHFRCQNKSINVYFDEAKTIADLKVVSMPYRNPTLTFGDNHATLTSSTSPNPATTNQNLQFGSVPHSSSPALEGSDADAGIEADDTKQDPIDDIDDGVPDLIHLSGSDDSDSEADADADNDQPNVAPSDDQVDHDVLEQPTFEEDLENVAGRAAALVLDDTHGRGSMKSSRQSGHCLP